VNTQFSRREFIAACAMASLAPAAALAQPKDVLNAGAVQFGTAHWLFDVIADKKLDASEGFTLSVRMLANNGAADIALLGHQLDVAVTDWFWVMRQRSLGGDFLFMPYSSALGSVIVPEASPIKSVAELQGKEIGVAGGPIDKSWILLRAYGLKHGAGDLASAAMPVFGAPPLLNEQAAAGRMAALLNFWPFSVRLEAKGWRRLVTVSEMMTFFGIAAGLPLVGFVFDGALAKEHPTLLQAFSRAFVKAQHILLESDSEWERIRPLMKANGDEEFRLLRDRYREGALRSWSAKDRQDAGKLFGIVHDIGGDDVTGAGVTFDPKAFWDGFVL
jgi:NitT/TauT family transport system substrate-binding protein